MVDIETLIVLTLNAIIAVVACIPFGIACKKQKNLRFSLLYYIFLAIESVLSIFQYEHFLIMLMAFFFILLTAIFFFIAVFLEYYKAFIKSYNQNLRIRDKFSVALIISLFIIGIEIFVIIIISISVLMLFRIYLKNHSPTKLFLLLTAISAIICVIAIYIRNFGVEGVYFFSNIINTFFLTLMLSTGFVALLEQKVIETSKEKNDLKDRYSHDLGNILHTITMAYDLFNAEQTSQMNKNDLNNLIKDKINDASQLVKFIRNI